MQYRMFTNSELKSFKAWLSDCPFDRSVKGAFDSKPRARDEEEMPESRGDIARLMKTLARGMSPENWAKWREELLGEEAEDGEYSTPHERLEAEAYPGGKRATEEPANFPGKPKTGAAMDAMAFDKLATPRRSKAEKSFDAMYPGAGDIKINSDSYPNMSRVRT